jgi:hypothetical protein
MSEGDEFKLQGGAATNTEGEQGSEGKKKCDHVLNGTVAVQKSLRFLSVLNFEYGQDYRDGCVIVGFHSRASSCATAICAGVMRRAMMSRFFTADWSPCAADKMNPYGQKIKTARKSSSYLIRAWSRRGSSATFF